MQMKPSPIKMFRNVFHFDFVFRHSECGIGAQFGLYTRDLAQRSVISFVSEK